MDPIIRDPLDQTRRHFFQGLSRRIRRHGAGNNPERRPGCSNCRDENRTASLIIPPSALPAPSQECHFSVHGWRSQSTGVIRSQTQATEHGRASDSTVVCRKQAVRVPQGRMPNCWVRAANSSNMALRAPRYQSVSLTWRRSVTNSL